MNWIKHNIIYLAWATAVIGLLSSLYFSLVKDFFPCDLCWYQRVLLYPLVIVLTVGILTWDKKLHLYVLPFTVIGIIIAGYHYLLQMNVFAQNIIPCQIGIPCETIYFKLFGFITIPFLSLIAFVFITVSVLIYKKASGENINE
ncbi:MAG: disulfide bond formation protein B [Candidatus Doudnabacteria bacterium]|nr:disulfide bond formation protein B [Candidatus Doudnabacteria bacterium]